MAEEGYNALVLLGLGLDYLSTTPLSLPRVKHTIRTGRADTARQIAREVLGLATAHEVEVFVAEAFSHEDVGPS